MTEPNSTRPATCRYFKCLRCGWMHIGIQPNNAQEQVRQAEAFYVVASKINRVTTRGPDAYLECYERCYWCGAAASDFIPIRECDVPISSSSIAEVIMPELPTFRDLQLNYEQKFEVWAYVARCNDAGVPWDTISLDRLLSDLLSDEDGDND
ncbi:hypothetical protein [Massilia soli]|uniref:Uncharacterized protein n=1 Tax=Massilia soli TaxID=2792854 RepID=A0ABS7SLF8_9BURK|nr:hypothetical protein [Massilia soli]MBZ2206522.1 hypothetical protein [Massilia soli]